MTQEVWIIPTLNDSIMDSAKRGRLTKSRIPDVEKLVDAATLAGMSVSMEAAEYAWRKHSKAEGVPWAELPSEEGMVDVLKAHLTRVVVQQDPSAQDDDDDFGDYDDDALIDDTPDGFDDDDDGFDHDDYEDGEDFDDDDFDDHDS